MSVYIFATRSPSNKPLCIRPGTAIKFKNMNQKSHARIQKMYFLCLRQGEVCGSTSINRKKNTERVAVKLSQTHEISPFMTQKIEVIKRNTHRNHTITGIRQTLYNNSIHKIPVKIILLSAHQD
jgi:hypothetical protein